MAENDAPIDEAQVIREVLAGRREAYALLVRRHQERVLSLCLSLTRNLVDAEDAAQDVFVKAFRKLPEFRRESSFSTWLYRIAYRHCLDLLRSGKRRRTESLDALDEAGEQPADRADGPATSPAAEGAAEALAGLRPEDRLMLTLREVQGLSYEEIARATERSLDAVKARLKRARRALQERARHLFAPSDV